MEKINIKDSINNSRNMNNNYHNQYKIEFYIHNKLEIQSILFPNYAHKYKFNKTNS